MEGETVTLTCTSTGSKPPAKIQWYKGDEELTGEGCGQCVNVFFCCLGVCAQLSVGHWIYCSWHCAELRLCRNACWAWRLFCGKGRLLVVTRWLLWLQFDICTFVCISLLVRVDRAVFVSYSCHIACCLFMRPKPASAYVYVLVRQQTAGVCVRLETHWECASPLPSHSSLPSWSCKCVHLHVSGDLRACLLSLCFSARVDPEFIRAQVSLFGSCNISATGSDTTESKR